ncbi:MAG: hypothetical protein H8E48_06605 [Chloroflexi bacterium]|nr:hypothetical protein [Chloroflexota bacterium]
MNETDLTFNEVIGMVKGIGAQEAQIDMFPELQPDPVRDQAVAGFTTAFDQVLRALTRIENMDHFASHPGTLTAGVGQKMVICWPLITTQPSPPGPLPLIANCCSWIWCGSS